MNTYLPERWRAILRHNQLDSFDRLWSLDAGWFEQPNQRRGGWSGVSRYVLELPEGGKVAIFLKRQENHLTRSLQHPFGIPTFVREMNNILLFQKASVPALEPVFFSIRKNGFNRQAILCTRALDGYVSLQVMEERWTETGWPKLDMRRRLMTSVAAAMNTMHDHRIQHNCFYPKHIFVRYDGDDVSVRIIDLEKAKVCLLRRLAMFRDLYTLNRHALYWRRSDRLRFLLIYLGLKRLNPGAKSLWRKIARRTLSKAKVEVSG